MCGGRLERYVDVQVSTHVGEGNGKRLVYLDCGDIYTHLCIYTYMWCWRRLLRIPWTARRSNWSILKEISPGCSLEGLMLKLKL